MSDTATAPATRRRIPAPTRGVNTGWPIPPRLILALTGILIEHALGTIAAAKAAAMAPNKDATINHPDMEVIARCRQEAERLFEATVLDSPAHSVIGADLFKFDVMTALVEWVTSQYPKVAAFSRRPGELEVTLDAFYSLMGIRRYPVAPVPQRRRARRSARR